MNTSIMSRKFKNNNFWKEFLGMKLVKNWRILINKQYNAEGIVLDWVGTCRHVSKEQ